MWLGLLLQPPGLGSYIPSGPCRHAITPHAWMHSLGASTGILTGVAIPFCSIHCCCEIMLKVCTPACELLALDTRSFPAARPCQE